MKFTGLTEPLRRNTNGRHSRLIRIARLIALHDQPLELVLYVNDEKRNHTYNAAVELKIHG